MKIAIYARVSKDERYNDDRYQEPENQLVPLRKWAENMGWEVYKEYVDKGSGADSNRKGFQLMLMEAMMLRFKVILVWKLDRFSRENLSIVIGRIQTLKARGVGVKSLTETWLDTSEDNPVSELILAIMSWAASEERRKISERTKAAIARKKAIGQWTGGRPKITLTNKDKKVIKELIERGKTIPQISRKIKVSKETIKKHLKKKGG